MKKTAGQKIVTYLKKLAKKQQKKKSFTALEDEKFYQLMLLLTNKEGQNFSLNEKGLYFDQQLVEWDKVELIFDKLEAKGRNASGVLSGDVLLKKMISEKEAKELQGWYDQSPSKGEIEIQAIELGVKMNKTEQDKMELERLLNLLDPNRRIKKGKLLVHKA